MRQMKVVFDASVEPVVDDADASVVMSEPLPDNVRRSSRVRASPYVFSDADYQAARALDVGSLFSYEQRMSDELQLMLLHQTVMLCTNWTLPFGVSQSLTNGLLLALRDICGVLPLLTN